MERGKAIATLGEWLAGAFTATELTPFLLRHGGAKLARALPGPELPLARFAFEAAVLCERHGLLDQPEWWEALGAERPRRRAEIDALRNAFGIEFVVPEGLVALCDALAERRLRGEEPGDLPERIRALKVAHGARTEFAEGFIVGGRFRLIQELGRGGFGTVWQALERLPRGRQRTVAVKVLHAQFVGDASRERRFQRGAAVMAAIDHPNVVRVLDPGGLEGGRLWFVMEYLDGGTLGEALQEGRLDRAAALRAVLEVGEALTFAHGQGLVHRDVKPANILLDRAGRARLSDFDLVSDETFSVATQTRAIGDAVYAAPEQMELGDAVDLRADVHALAMTALWSFCGGRLPKGMAWDRKAALDQAPLTPPQRVVLRRGLAPNPAERYASIPELCSALRAVAAPVAGVAVGVGDAQVDRVAPSVSRVEPAAGAARVLTLPGGLLLSLRYIPSGRFWMGSPDGVGDRDEHPRHEVMLTQGYWLGETPVTQAQWGAVATPALAGLKPRFPGPDRPMESVSWGDVEAWLQALAAAVPEAAGARLPTEAEWERAARAGTDTRWSHGEDEAALGRFAWYGEGESGQTHPVGQKLANPWGLLDIHGNVWEWCADEWKRTYTAATVTDPRHGDARGGYRVVGGGSFWLDADWCRSACRSGNDAGSRWLDQGFRLLLPAVAPPPMER